MLLLSLGRRQRAGVVQVFGALHLQTGLQEAGGRRVHLLLPAGDVPGHAHPGVERLLQVAHVVHPGAVPPTSIRAIGSGSSTLPDHSVILLPETFNFLNFQVGVEGFHFNIYSSFYSNFLASF